MIHNTNTITFILRYRTNFEPPVPSVHMVMDREFVQLAVFKFFLFCVYRDVNAVFNFNRIVAKRTVLHCFVNTQAELMFGTQRSTLRFATIQLWWKTEGRRKSTELVKTLFDLL